MSDHYTKLLVDNSDLVEGFTPDDQVALLVHESVFEKLKQLHVFNCDGLGSCWDYDLKINGNIFDMKLIYFTLESNEKLKLLRNFIEMSQFSFPWEDQPTVFCDIHSAYLLEEFIALHNLKPDIVKIEDKSGVTRDGDLIKTISFNATEFHLIENYRKFVSLHSSVQQQFFYINFAFPWLQPNALKHFEIAVDTNLINSVLPIVLETFEYSNELNLFDLLNLKLAFCDPRNTESSTFQIQHEIDYVLKRSINKMSTKQTYIQNRHFDLHQYAFDHNFVPGDIFPLIPYFQYESQNYIETIEKLENIVTEFVSATIKLIDHQNDDVQRKLNKKSNIKFTIDGIGFDRINTALLANLLAHENIVKIVLDTNFHFAAETIGTYNKSINKLNRIVEINLIGSNTFNFTNKLITTIKTNLNLQNADKYLDVIINGSRCITNDLLFDNFVGRQIIFRNIKITTPLLDDLSRSTLKIQYIRFDKCTFENKPENWKLLNELKQLQHTIIQEDDGTWQCIFDFIANTLSESAMDQFQFNRSVTILSEGKQINFKHLQFTIDKINTKLQFEDVHNDGQLIDLFDLKNRFLYGEKSDYDFYQ